MCIHGEINTSWIRKQKADVMSQAYKAGIAKRDQLKIEVYNNAVVSPIFFNQGKLTGGVMDEDGNPILLSKLNVFSMVDKRTEDCTLSDEIAVYCGGCWGYPFHWGHFLLDVVPHLWYVLLKEQEEDLSFIILGLEGKEDCDLSGNFLEFLRLLGIEKKVRILSKTTRFRKVIIPEKSYDYNSCIAENGKKNYYSDMFLDTFKVVIKNALSIQADSGNNEKHQKIYMARRCEGDCGVELIENIFQNNGFDIIDPVELSLTELIQKLHTCETVAYISGTLQHNLLFAPLGIRAIAIERRAWISPVQIDIDIIKKLHVDYLEAGYSIIPDESLFFGLYGYTEQLKDYIKHAEWNPPDRKYLAKEYCESAIKKYIGNYDLSAFGGLREIYDEYIFAAYQESVGVLCC